jgi:hypothetical protein
MSVSQPRTSANLAASANLAVNGTLDYCQIGSEASRLEGNTTYDR